MADAERPAPSPDPTASEPPARSLEADAGAAPEQGAAQRRQWRALLKGLVLIVTLAGAGFALSALKLDENLDRHAVAAALDGLGPLGWLVFALATGLLTAAGLPRQIPAFIGGYVYGVAGGTLLATLGAALGCGLDFAYARFLGRELVRRRFARRIGSRLQRFDRFLAQSPLAMSLILRLMPVGNNMVTSLAGGLTSIPLWPFLAGSFLGYVPQHLIFALVGKGVRVDPGLRIGLAVALFVASTLWGFALYRKYRAADVVSDEDEETDKS